MNDTIIESIRKNRSLIRDTDAFCVDTGLIISLCMRIRSLFFPGHFRMEKSEEEILTSIRLDLDSQIALIDVDHETISNSFMEKLPLIQEKLYKDLKALYNGDPSAKTCTEIIVSFPGYLAVFLYRIAHELYELGVPIIPRIIAEYAHEKTGIDINPGAKIGEYFCIDHGTGIVIGETAVVGDHVRMYHGVTLGVRSFRKDEEGNLLKGGKRHPNIGDHVILYANATVLGGDTFIRSGTTVPAGSLILHTPETFL